MQIHTASLLHRLMARGKFRHLQVLLALVELGSVQRAANSIGLSQSSVTQSLAYLEDLLEVALFERHARGVSPTPACQDLLPLARQMMQGLVSGAEALDARRRLGEGTIRLLASAAGLHGVLMDRLPTFAAAHPGILVQVTEVEGAAQWQAIARGEVDLALCRRRPVLPEGWAFTPLLEDRMVVVCAASHPLAHKRKPSTAALARHSWLLMPAGTAARAHFEQMVAGFPVAPPTHPVVSSSLHLILALLQLGQLALLPQTVVRPHIRAGTLVELQTSVDISLEPVGLLHPQSGFTASTAAQAFCEFLAAR